MIEGRAECKHRCPTSTLNGAVVCVTSNVLFQTSHETGFSDPHAACEPNVVRAEAVREMGRWVLISSSRLGMASCSAHDAAKNDWPVLPGVFELRPASQTVRSHVNGISATTLHEGEV